MTGTNIELATYIANAIRANTEGAAALIIKTLREINYGYNRA